MSDNTYTPPWGDKWTAPPPGPPGSHLFQKGHSGNPAGRLAGSKNRRTLIGRQLEAKAEDVAQATIKEALAGNMAAAKLVLERVHPPLRAEASRVQFELDPTKPLTAQGQQIVHAVSKGELDVDTAETLIKCLQSFAALREHDELAKRIDDLEQNVLAAATAGAVLGKVMQTALQEG